MSDYLHIICLDAPSPPDYGGAIDMHYKIRSLAEAGKKIILHYFKYRSGRDAGDLEHLCWAVYTYNRKNIWQALPLFRPFIVQSRINRQLIDRLNQDRHPVLLEGLHCAGLIPFLNDTKRAVLRMHNDEASYYHHLFKTESSVLKKFYYARESRLLKRFQKEVNKTVPLACLSQADIDVFKNEYGFETLQFIPCFIPWQQVSIRQGVGDYCLYHGNLLVSENEEAALWLVEQVFNRLDVPLIIAGKGASERLIRKAADHKNIRIEAQPSMAELDALIANAQVNVLPSMNRTGVKLKLLNALLNGRHCITNPAGVAGSNINTGVIVENSAEDWIATISHLMQQRFTEADFDSRRAILELYNNKKNAVRLSALWSHYQ